MTLHWPFLVLGAALALIAVGFFAMMRFEQRSGQAYLFFWKAPSWMSEAHPRLFNVRLGSYWIGIIVFALGAVADLAAFFGIVK